MIESLINHDADLKQMAKTLGCRMKDLLVLAKKNEPFRAGRSPAERKKAEWFADLWHRLGYDGQTGLYLRRVHYAIISQEEQILKPDGEPYRNIGTDFNYLCESGKYARYIRLVDPKAFIDRRNPDPHIYSGMYPLFDPDEEPHWTVSNEWEFNDGWRIPSIYPISFYDSYWNLPEFEVDGFDYDESLQPYHIEIWCEKGTQNDILLPICRRYGVNLVTTIGFPSITAVIQLLERIKRIGKPTRIFYISDFDPAGEKMPTSVSRQIEYWLNFYDLDFDIKLAPLVLTKEQVREYNLPRVPIKETDLRKKNFELNYGEGGVELDALEALHPGELARILTEKILEFRDEDLEKKIDRANETFDANVAKIWEENIEPYQDDLDKIKEEIEPILEKYNRNLESLNNELQDEVKPIKNRLENLRHVITFTIDDIEVDLPEKPHAEVCSHPSNEWLFDSKRDFLEQMKHYRQSRERAR